MEVLRAGRRLVLLLAVLLGVVTMHALAVDTAATTAIAATVTPPHDPKPGHTDAAGTSGPAIDSASAPMTVSTTAGAAAVMAASQAPQAPRATPPGPMPPMPPMPGHDLMHLCLAVLAALVVLLTGLVLLARERHTASTAAVVAYRPVHPTPRRPPPGHADRQAELCVLRN